MHSSWFRSTFVRVFKFLQIKVGAANFWGEPIFQKVWLIWSLLLDLNFKSFLDPNSSLFIRYQCILHDSGVLFIESWNFYKLKRGGPNFWWERILQEVWKDWSPLLYLNFKSSVHPNSSSFIRFQLILHDSGVVFSEYLNFCKLKVNELISWGIEFCRKS